MWCVGRTFFYFSRLSKIEAGGRFFGTFLYFSQLSKIEAGGRFFFFLLDINTMSGDGTYTHTIFKKCWYRLLQLTVFHVAYVSQ